MKFDPSTADANEDMTHELLPVGQYKAHVEEAEETQSKAGNDMIKITLLIDHEGKEYRIWDYITENATWKLSMLCKSISMVEQFATGNIDAGMLAGSDPLVTIKKKPAKGEWPEGRTVKSYDIGGEPHTPVVASVITDDDVPF